jgi:hypothetical protein
LWVKEKELIKLLRTRDYPALLNFTERWIKKKGWQDLAKVFIRLRKNEYPQITERWKHYRVSEKTYPTHATRDYNWPPPLVPEYIEKESDRAKAIVRAPNVTPGAIRNGYLQILGLGEVGGIDTDLNHTFGKLKCNKLEELQEKAGEIAREILNMQIEKLNTYFLDIDKIRQSKLVISIPEIVRARQEELENLKESITVRRALQTYYGLLLLANLVTKQRGKGIDEDSLILLEKTLSKEIGRPIEITPKLQSFGELKNCSEQMNVYLDMITSMFTTGYRSRMDYIDYIGSFGDSRVIPWIITRLGIVKGQKSRIKPKIKDKVANSLSLIYTHEVDALLGALGKIGTPECFEIVEKYASNEWECAAWALGGIRHPQALDSLIALSSSQNEKIARIAYCNIWRVETEESLDFLSACAKSKTCKFQLEAKKALGLLRTM